MGRSGRPSATGAVARPTLRRRVRLRRFRGCATFPHRTKPIRVGPEDRRRRPLQLARLGRTRTADALLRSGDHHRPSCLRGLLHPDRGVCTTQPVGKGNRHRRGRTGDSLRRDLFPETVRRDREARRIAHVQSPHRLDGDGHFASEPYFAQDGSPWCIIMDLRVRRHQSVARRHWRQRTRPVCDRTQPGGRASGGPVFLDD